MKKVLALVLAFVMVAGLATVAMAATTVNAPELSASIYTLSEKKLTEVTAGDTVEPGTALYIPVLNADALVGTEGNKLDAHKVSVEIEEGKKNFDSASIVSVELVEGGAWAGSGAGKYFFVKITTNETMALEDEDLVMNVKLGATKPDPVESSEEQTYTVEMGYNDDREVEELFGLGIGNFVVKAEDATDADWMDVDMFIGDDDAHFVTKMYKQADFFIGVDDDPVEKYEELYGDEAALDYLWVTMPKALKQAGTLYIPAAMVDEDKAPYLYEEKDGKLVQIKNAYDEENEEFVLKNVKTIGKYVISDIELDVKDSVDGDETEENPATGANDVVAIAAGLAVVSLVAAGAVSLKK